MFRKFLLVPIALLLLITSSVAQERQLTLEDAVWNQWFSLRPKSLNQIDWITGTSDYVYIEGYSEVFKGSLKKDASSWFTIEDVNAALKEKDMPTIGYLYGLKWLGENTFYQVFKNIVYIYDVNEKEIKQGFVLPENADNIFYCPKADAVAFTVDNNIQLMDKDGKITKISNEENKGIVYGSNYVHRQEFGIDKGIFWSPDGKYIAFYRKDETMVADYPLVDYTTFPATAKPIKYPMTGQTSEEVTLGIYEIATGKTVYMKTGTPKDHFLTSITWDPSSDFIYIGILNRDQNHLWFNKYSRTDGEFVKTLFEETNPKYVEPLHPAYFMPKNQNEFIWISRRTGFYHLFLYDTDGKMIKQLTDGQWDVTDFYGVDNSERNLYIQSTSVCALQRHIYKVDIANGKMKELTTDEEGYHNATFTSDYKYFIDDYSSIKVPHITNIDDNNGKVKKELLNASNPLADFKLGNLKVGTIKAADGKTDLYYRLITPPDYDSTKKYPVIIYVYGGPHAQLIDDSWLSSVRLWQFYMAQKGYVMFTLDNRGSSNRGMEFESVTFRHLGVEEMKDQLEGVKFLSSLPFVDTSRIGVHGWSFGGFMTTSLITTYPDVFKVAVAGGPVIDWKYYEVMYGERYMDTPETNPDGYEQTSVLNKIKNLKGKLMIIHGGVDPVVVPQNSRSLMLEAQKLGIDIDFYEFPNSEHNVRGKERILLMQKVTEYFDQNL